MIRAITSLLLFPCALMASSWVSGSKVNVISPSVSAAPQAVFFNSYTGMGPKPGEWQTVDLNNVIPDAKAIHITGILIITHGSSPETADMVLYFRDDESYRPDGNYKHQVIEANVGSGQRSTMSTWVSLKNGMFQYKWETKQVGHYPERSAYGANLVIDAYISN